MLPKQKGDLAFSYAIHYFMTHGYEVCLPIGDKQDYDLVVEKKGKLARVQVKYAGLYAGKSTCRAALRVMGGNQSFYLAKKYADNAFELLFVHTAKGDNYLLPWSELRIRNVLCIEAAKYKPYKVCRDDGVVNRI